MNNPTGCDHAGDYQAIADVEKIAVENTIVGGTDKIIAVWVNAGRTRSRYGLGDEASQQILMSGAAASAVTAPDGVGARAFDVADVGLHDQTG